MYRTVKISWLPNSKSQWEVFTKTRLEAGRLWSDLVDIHEEARKKSQDSRDWPNYKELSDRYKGICADLQIQSVQQIVKDFCDAIKSVKKLLQNGDLKTEYPYKKPKYKDVVYTNQQARIRNGYLILFNGRNVNPIKIKLPWKLKIPGRLMEICLKYGEVLLICKIEDLPKQEVSSTIGIDLGINTLIAVTNGKKVVCISGREIKAINQYRSKKLSTIKSKRSKQKKGSRRDKKLQRRKYRMLDKCKRKINDILHKATRKVSDVFPNSKAFVGKPFNNACQRTGRKQSQMIGEHCGRRIISLLSYKLQGSITEINEAYSSQTCPVCGERNRCGRIYLCKNCGFSRPRDVIGSSNILCKGLHNAFIPGCPVLNSDQIRWVYPIKYSVVKQIVPLDTGQVALAVLPERIPDLYLVNQRSVIVRKK